MKYNLTNYRKQQQYPINGISLHPVVIVEAKQLKYLKLRGE